jgi:predicted Zn-dependent peptidase
MKSLLREQLDLLVTNPPSPQEIEAARAHVLGRHLSAAQSNPELAEALTNQWILYGRLESEDELRQKLEDVTRDDIMQVLPVFTSGSIVSIRNP